MSGPGLDRGRDGDPGRGRADGSDAGRRRLRATTLARRELAAAVALAVVGGGLAVWAASHTWTVGEIARTAPLPPVRSTISGRDLVPWAAAMAFVALAAGLALLATRRVGRVVLGAVLALAGVAMVAGGLTGWFTDGAVYQRVVVQARWPIAFLAGGLAVLAAGGLAIARGRWWPAMGTRYEAPGRPGESDRLGPADDAPGIWDALDRGEDPTVR